MTTSGKWKIGGFGFMIQQTQGDMKSENITLYRSVLDPVLNPNSQYCGPEFFENEQKYLFTQIFFFIQKRYDMKSDMVPLAMLCYTIFNYKRDKTLKQPEYLPSDLLNLKQKLGQMGSDFYKGDFTNIFPNELASFFQRSTNKDPAQRPFVSELMCNIWINDTNVRGIYNLNDFYKLEDTKQKMYLKGLAKMIPNYTSKILRTKIVPFIKKEVDTEKNNAELVSI